MPRSPGLFDIICHADLCKKFCFIPKQRVQPLFTQFLQVAKLSESPSN